MTKRKRLGRDPLEHPWIRDTREDSSKSTASQGSTSEERSSEEWTRATFIVRRDLLERVKDFAYWERLQIKEVINAALEGYLEGKRIKRRPEGR